MKILFGIFLGAIIYWCWPFFLAIGYIVIGGLGNTMLLGWNLLFYVLVAIIGLKIVYKVTKYIIKSIFISLFRPAPNTIYKEETS